MLQIDKEKCIGCGLCAKSCFSNAIKIEEKKAIPVEGCIYCGSCVGVCPVKAIKLETSDNGPVEDLSSYKGVWVIIENDPVTKMPKKVSYELLSEGRKLADKLGEDVYAVDLCVGADGQTMEELQSVGCDHLILVEDAVLEQYNTELFSGIVTGLIRQRKPSIVLFAGTQNGRDLAPRVSAKLQVGLTADCTGLEINEAGELVQVRPTYGGNVIASIVTPNHRPQMASVRGNVFSVVHAAEKKELDVIKSEILIDKSSLKVKRVGFKPKKVIYKDVEEADIVIVGGYGAGKKGFELIHELAIKLSAAVGATRKAVDEGWAPFEIQVGQTGKVVAPDLYICFGVSGALQHTIGIRGAKKIIAVNDDPTAQIFGMADVAILGDSTEILQTLIKLADEKGREVFSVS
ncbi:MAG: electron transfer flavoprotein subunit alpha [Lachnospiraceae bacterium]|nr:electron transfer flavoprotein subunit alpha [Lachnospiraceae bacterium]